MIWRFKENPRIPHRRQFNFKLNMQFTNTVIASVLLFFIAQTMAAPNPQDCTFVQITFSQIKI